MTEIPQDIWDAADQAHYLGYLSKDSRVQVDHIAKAILAERERCMLVARDWPLAGLIKTNDKNPQSIFASGARAQSRTIADAIMNGEPNGK